MNINAEDMFGDDFGFANMGNMNISILVNEKDTYFIDENSKTYAPMDALFKFAGDDFSKDDFTGAFGDMDMGVDVDLADADKTVTENFNGVSCKKYVFASSDGSSTNVYMNGKKLVAIVYKNADGKDETKYVFNKITLTVPSSYTVPPTSYKVVDPLEMLAGLLIGGDIGSMFG